MDVLITIVIFLLVLAVIVLAHEFGHFITAKKSGVKVEEFGLGFPPRIASFKRGETIYSLNAIPLGGFTKMSGEEDPKAERSLASKKPWPRLLILAAGSIMNLLLPLVLFSIAFMVPHQAYTENAIIGQVSAGSPADLAGIQAGDRIISINGKTIENTADVRRYIYLNLGHEMTMGIQRGSIQKTVTLTPRWKPPENQGAIGIQFDVQAVMDSRIVYTTREPFLQAIPMGVVECGETLVLFKNSILSIVSGASSATTLTGPVGVAQITGEAARAGISPLLEFAAFLSINLGIINLFPIPALDGGRIIFVLIEIARRGKRISPKTEGLVHLIGFALLITLMVFVTYQDIFRIVSGG